MLQRVRQYLIDSYNGLYLIVIAPSMPTKGTVAKVLLGLIIGLIWAYGINPIQFYDAAPSQLSASYRQQWAELVAAAAEAQFYDDEAIRQLFAEIENPAAAIDRAISQATPNSFAQQALQNARPLAEAAGSGKAAPKPGGLIGDLISGWIIPALLITIITPILVVVWRMLIYPNIVAGLIERFKMMRDKDYREQRMREKAELERIRTQREAAQNVVVETDTELGEPITTKVSIYTPGRAYDDSFAIEDANDTFLGEMGASVAKRIGDNQVAAVEVWLFDKEDFVRTLNKIFVSEHGFNDPATRAELENKVENPATDIIQISEGAEAVMETDQLRVRARVKRVEYGSDGSMPSNSYFDGLQIELAAWQKGESSGPYKTSVSMPSATPGATPTPSPVTPATPAGSGAPSIQPLSPPPMQTPPSTGQVQPVMPAT
ncbi:MAG: hypothetical protein D6712_01550, partial [Chloroflexi bacterium]